MGKKEWDKEQPDRSDQSPFRCHQANLKPGQDEQPFIQDRIQFKLVDISDRVPGN